MKHHNKLKESERDKIAIMKAVGWGVREIARTLGRSPGTICEELKRNSNRGVYVAIQAQHETEQRILKARLRHPLKNKDVWRYVTDKLGWFTPTSIMHRALAL